MSSDWVTDDIDHGTRKVAGVEVRIREERWRYGGSSFSVYRVSDGLDLTQEVHGQCFDNPPDDDEIKSLLDGLDEDKGGGAADQPGVIRWEQPPPSRIANRTPARRPSRLAPIADELRGRPGEWAVVFEGERGKAGGMVTHIRLGQVLCFTPTGDFDATLRHIDGKSVVYARYVGEDTD